jgi:hypothetical protein
MEILAKARLYEISKLLWIILHFTYIENFKAGNIEYTYVVISLGFGVKTVIDSLYQPVKQTVVQRLELNNIFFQILFQDKYNIGVLRVTI